MRVPDSQALQLLAAEYVLGTLRGAARRRMARWIETHAAVRMAVLRWEDELMPLIRRLPETPSPHVWMAIRRRIKAIETRDPPAGRARYRPVTRWAAAAVVLLGLSYLLWQAPSLRRPPASPALVAYAQVTDTGGRVLWQISVSPAHDRLYARAVAPEARGAAQDFELWALPPSGPPISLGVLPVDGELSRPLTLAQQGALRAAVKIAVSLEASGGSRSGAPQGPIVHVADLRRVG